MANIDSAAIEPGASSKLRTTGWSVLQSLATIAVLILMAHTLLNVFMRYGFNSPVRGTNEIVAGWYMPLIGFTGFIIAQYLDRHISATLVFDRLPVRIQREVTIAGAILCAVTCGLFAYHTAIEALHSYEINRRVIAGTISIIVWPVTFAAPIAYAALCVMFFRSAWRYLQGKPLISGDAEHALASVTPVVTASGPRNEWIARAVVLAIVAGSIVAIFTFQGRIEIAVSALVLMLCLLFLKIPVAFALAIPGLLSLWAIRPRAVYTMLQAEPYEAVATWSYSVLPMFVLMGLLLWKSGLTSRIYVAARLWLSWLPGGLAVSTNTAGTGLAAVSGSTLATTYALSRIGIPEMLKAGYDRRLAVGSVIVAGLPGQLIPPSTFLIIYASIAEVPIGPQLMAGILPGLMVAGVFSIAMVLLSLAVPRLVGSDAAIANKETVAGITWGERWASLIGIWPLPVLILIVLGGMYTGVFTATEAGAAGAFGALLVSLFLLRGKALKPILEAGMETVIITGMIFLLIIGAEILSSMLTLSGLANGFATWVSAAGFEPFQFLIIIMIVYLVLGMFMDPLPMLLLTVPLLIPILNDMSISLLWFGVFAVFMAELAILTPPVGILSFIIHNLVQDKSINMGQKITLGDVFVSVGAFMPIAVLIAVLMILFPEVATWLPDQMIRR